MQQLPSVCDNRDSAEYLSNITSDELQGREYMQAMSRMLVIPCGGSTVNASGGFVEPGAVVSCREAFCSEGVSSEVAQQCRVNCQGHPFFCKESCEADEQSGTCQSSNGRRMRPFVSSRVAVGSKLSVKTLTTSSLRC